MRHAVLLVFAAAASAQSWQAEVNLATDRGIEHLLRTQCANGDFRVGSSGEYPMGPAALATYTLLKSGLPRQDPAIVRAFAFLRALPFKKVYSTATLIMALDARKDPAMDPWIAEAAAWIEENLDPDTGLWSYPGRGTDLSNTHFAAYGLWLASAHGYRPSKRTWLKVMRATVKLQNRDGGFGYRPRDRPESAGSMTVAGITVLTIVRKALSGSYAARTAKKPLARAWGWLDRVFSATGNPRGRSGLVHHGEHALWYYYYLFGLERIAALSSRTQIGGRDWYREGALQLLRREKDGDWPGATSFENTCFALLFLRRATFTQLSGDSPLAGAAGAVHWRHAMHAPSGGWTEHDYDDSQWAVAVMQAETRAVLLRVSLVVAVGALLGAAAITTYLVVIGGPPASAWLIWFGKIAAGIAAACVVACVAAVAVVAGFQRLEAPMAKRWSAVHEGHEVVVENYWFSGCKLYVDGECRGINKDALAWNPKKPRLTTTIEGEYGESHAVVVFAKTPLFGGVKIRICVDGNQIGGDVF